MTIYMHCTDTELTHFKNIVLPGLVVSGNRSLPMTALLRLKYYQWGDLFERRKAILPRRTRLGGLIEAKWSPPYYRG